jgi:peptidyl-prolyl cis-trans isomerase C
VPRLRLLSPIVALLVLASPWSATAAPAAAGAQAPEPPAAPVPAQLPDVVARVNGEAIAKTDLESAVTQLEARAGRSVPADQRDRVLRGVLDQLIAYRLLLQESATRKVSVADADVDSRVGEIRSQYPSEEAFAEALSQRHLTVDQLRVDLRQGLQIDRMLTAELAGKTAVTPEQVEQFYAGNTSEFQQGERVRASHILIAVPPGAGAPARDEARLKAAQILTDLKSGKDFAELAKQHSQDPGSAPNGGDLGYFERGQMVGPFEEAAFTLPPSQLSEIVESQFGFHIIKVADKQAARTIPLAEVRPQVEAFLEERNRSEQTDAFIAALRAKGKVEILI